MAVEEAGGIWDSHVHMLPAHRTRGLVRWIRKTFPEHTSHEEMAEEDVMEDLRACGVEVMFNFVFPLEPDETDILNEFNRDLAARREGVVPFGSLHLETPDKEGVAERCICEMGLAGMKLHPYAQGFEVFSHDFEPMYRKLNELKKPFVVHTGFDVFYRKTQDVDHLRTMLERYPDMPVVLVHAFFPNFHLAVEMLERYPQVYADLTNVISAVRYYLDDPGISWSDRPEPEDMAANLGAFDELIERFSDRMMFGTDHPAGMGSPEQIYRDLDSFKFAPEVRESLLCGTARRFLLAHCMK